MSTTTTRDNAAAIAEALDTRTADQAIGILAFEDNRSDAALAEAVAEASVRRHYAAEAFTPTDALPHFEAFVSTMALRKPHAISPKTVGNYRNAVRFLDAAGIDRANAEAFANAKALVSKNAKAAMNVAARLVTDDNRVDTLAQEVTGKAGKAAVDAVKRAEAAEADRAKRDADPVAYALAALLRTAEGDAAASVALARALRAAATHAERQADAAAGGSAVVSLSGETLAA